MRTKAQLTTLSGAVTAKLVLSCLLLCPSHIRSQHRVELVLEKTDTCLALSLLVENNFLKVDDKHRFMDELKCIKAEKLMLHKGTDWLSIPRLPSNSTSDWDEKDPAPTVWDRDNFETPYTEVKDLYHWHTDASGDGPYEVFWSQDSWTYYPDEGGNKSTWSYRGYQLDVVPDGENYIYLTGNVKDPATEFPLYHGKKNWVGYFLPGEQDVFDALGAATLANLSNIKHRDYYCYKGPAIEAPTGGIVNGYPWRCDQQQTNIAYGDMVILNVVGNIADFDMAWQNPGSVPRDKIRPEPSHFEFAEAGTYTPIMIELGYTVNPLEIGAFVNDSCMGAESVMESDTVIILRAYLNGGNPDSVVFQDWDGTKSAGRKIKSYAVYDPSTGIYENRALWGNTHEEMPRVSFKKRDKEKKGGLMDHKIDIWPNPASHALNYSFACDDGTDVRVTLLDVRGRQLKLLLDQRLTKGYYSQTATLDRRTGGVLAPGLYFVRFDIGGFIDTKKLVIN
ncbi:MAG: T9SS type A sorting domain-containing protein [Chlorobi bacterium]|nr:T9SS type A sorting domain-containing protein [Chlorobiota bacterium]